MNRFFPLRIFIFVIALYLVSCHSKRQVVHNQHKKPKKIILLIGDGMGLTQISTLFLEKDNTNNFKRFKHIGFMNTRSGSHKITDSAAGATAFACGKKTYNNSIGMDMDTASVPNLIELFSERNYATGVISTSAITHATPASFYAHTAHRRNEFDIAKQLLRSDIDFFAGGGNIFFKDMGADMTLFNWDIDTNASQNWENVSFNPAHKYGFLLSNKGMSTMETGRTNFLPDATKAALRYVGKSKSFIMVEGSQIDWGGHANDYSYVLTEMQDFDKTVGEVLDYAEKDGNTLVIVTADHETGGLTLSGEDYKDKDGNIREDYDKVSPTFSSGGHTAVLIPVFAYGPGSHHFQGFYENNEIFNKILALMK
ncbi:MAG: alkaline phosphatase [Bacteroidia bacterium]|jgi:alkaline phosphatase